MKKRSLLIGALFLLLFPGTGAALPLTGLYYQTANVAEMELYDGIIHVGYWFGNTPANQNGLTANTAGGTLDGTLRAPIPLFDSERFKGKVLLGYHLQSASTSNAGVSVADTVSGIEYGLLLSYQLSPGISIMGDYLQTSLLSGSSSLGPITIGNTSLNRFEGGLTIRLPQGGQLVLGYESWSAPRELGSGTNLSGQTTAISGFVVGLNYQIF